MSFKLKEITIFTLRFSAYGLAVAFLFLLITHDNLLQNISFPSTFKPNHYSFNNAVESAAPAVVNVYASRLYQEKEYSVFQNPLLQRFFGNPSESTKTRPNSSIGSGVIIDADRIYKKNHRIRNNYQIL